MPVFGPNIPDLTGDLVNTTELSYSGSLSLQIRQLPRDRLTKANISPFQAWNFLPNEDFLNTDAID